MTDNGNELWISLDNDVSLSWGAKINQKFVRPGGYDSVSSQGKCSGMG